MSKEYGKTLIWLNELNQNKIKPGLERIKKLMNLAGNPQNELRIIACLLYTSPSPRDGGIARMPSSA